MNLRDITLFMSFDSGYKDPFRDKFNLSVKFINHYISKKVRLLKIETNDSISMINIEPFIGEAGICSLKGEKALNVTVEFDKDLYLKLNEIEKNDYYLKLINQGYSYISKSKNIDLTELFSISEQLKKENFINEWRHKKKKFKDQNLEIELICKFSTSSFILILIASDTISKEVLLNDVLIKTLPDEVCFVRLFKDIIIKDNKLIITEFQNRPKFIFDLEDVYKKRFVFKLTDVGLIYEQII